MRFLFVDRIIELIPGKLVRGIKHITYNDTCLYPDEFGNYCFPSSLIGETLGQLAAWNVMITNDFSYRPVAGVVDSAKLYKPAYVGETLLLESIIDMLDESVVQYHSTAYIGKDSVFSIDGALGPLLPMSRFIGDADIRRQFAEINHPGEWPYPLTTINSKTLIPNSKPLSYYPLLTFDRVLSSEPGVSIVAEKRISLAAPYFLDHFPYNPVLPLTVLLEAKINLAHLFLLEAKLDTHYQISELRKIKMNGFVSPGDSLICRATMQQRDDQQLILRYRSEVDNKRVCVLDIIMRSKGEIV
jgi:3-hydroxymyristoyl/3-hydroxydecanoyl-(acyl carrier protein) dehydratase